MYSNYSLSKLFESLVTDKGVYFLGGPFGNFYHVELEFRGRQYISSEQAYMHAKAIYFRDQSSANKILEATTSAKSKRLGRQVKNFLQDAWNDVSYDIMLQINRAKYRNPILSEALLLTGNRILVECNPNDAIWGIGLSSSSGLIHDPATWKGQNLLGQVLMQVRSELSPK